MDWVRGTDCAVVGDEFAEAIKKVNSDAAETENKRSTMITREMLPCFLFIENNN